MKKPYLMMRCPFCKARKPCVRESGSVEEGSKRHFECLACGKSGFVINKVKDGGIETIIVSEQREELTDGHVQWNPNKEEP
jgi:transcriptional regulator NrdR family protein